MKHEECSDAIKQEFINNTRSAFSEYIVQYMVGEDSRQAREELNEYYTQAVTGGHFLRKFYGDEDLESTFNAIKDNAIANARAYAHEYDGCGYEVNDELVAHAQDFFQKQDTPTTQE